MDNSLSGVRSSVDLSREPLDEGTIAPASMALWTILTPINREMHANQRRATCVLHDGLISGPAGPWCAQPLFGSHPLSGIGGPLSSQPLWMPLSLPSLRQVQGTVLFFCVAGSDSVGGQAPVDVSRMQGELLGFMMMNRPPSVRHAPASECRNPASVSAHKAPDVVFSIGR